MTRSNNGFVKHLTRLTHQYSTLLQIFTNQLQLGDPWYLDVMVRLRGEKLPQPITKEQESYLKDSTNFINFIEKKREYQRTLFLFQWTSQACTQIYLKRKVEKQYAMHTNLTIKENPPSQHNILKERLFIVCLNKVFQRNYQGKDIYSEKIRVPFLLRYICV